MLSVRLVCGLSEAIKYSFSTLLSVEFVLFLNDTINQDRMATRSLADMVVGVIKFQVRYFVIFSHGRAQ